MIISASRRTDIPAFYSEWFMNRVREGYCLVANPFNPKQVSRVSLNVDDVDAIVFWSKDPAPLMRHLDELDELGYRYLFQYTICDYPPELEPFVPPLAERIATARELALRLGPRRVIWRYDPIILSNNTGPEFHRRAFARIAAALEGSTTRIVLSLVDYYGKTRRNLKPLEQAGWVFQERSGAEDDARELLRWMAHTARDHGLEAQSCAEAVAMDELGIARGKCIDGELLNELWQIPVSKKDPGQRRECLCAVSKDIGTNGTCLHGCRYCYATSSNRVASSRFKGHDPSSSLLCGHVRPEMLERSTKEATDVSQLRLCQKLPICRM